jgi:acetyl esterase/lipase
VYAVIGDSLALRLDLFLPGRVETSDGPRRVVHAEGVRWPLIIWIHGGGWRGGSRTDPSPALALLDSGFAVANIDYRLSRRALWPAQLHDAKAAVRWLRAHADVFDLDTARFVAWGTSAGAHIAAMLGVTSPADSLEGAVGDHPGVSSAVKAVVGYHGAFNFLEPVPRRWTRWSSVGELLGCAVPECWERARLASPLSYVSLGDAPFFIAHGTADSTVPFTQSTMMDSTLRTLRVPVEFVPLPDAAHGGPGFVSEGMIGRVRDFLRRVFTGADETSSAPDEEASPPATADTASAEAEPLRDTAPAPADSLTPPR